MIPDHIYERSVIKQLRLSGAAVERFSKSGDGTSVIETCRESGLYAEVSSCLFFNKEEMKCPAEIKLAEKDLNSLRRKLLCNGADLERLKVSLVFTGRFDERILRKLSVELYKISEHLELIIEGISVFHDENGTDGVTALLTGRGRLKPLSEAPWQRRGLIEGEDIVITGSIGRAGSIKEFKKHREEMIKEFPEIYIKRLEKRIGDRLPLRETEAASFYGVTAMEAAEEGGLEAALWRLGNREDAGLEIYFDRLFFEQETMEIAEFLKMNPLRLSSEGVYIAAGFKGEAFTEALRSAGISAVLAGKVIKDRKRIIHIGDEERFIESPK